MATITAWMLPGVMLELAILMFMWFRRIERFRIVMVIPAVFGLFALLMFILSLAVLLAEELPPIEPDLARVLNAAFVFLAFLIFAIPRYSGAIKPAANAGSAGLPATEAPARERSLIVDLLGCVGIVVLAAAALIAFTALVVVYGK
jgi:hypothetical protein